MYAPHNTEFMKQKLTQIKGEIDKPRIKVGNFNTPILAMIKERDKKIIKDTEVLNKLDLNDIFRRLYSITAEHTFFANTRSLPTHVQHLPNLTICWVMKSEHISKN